MTAAPRQPPPIIVLAGNIATGKTTLARRIAAQLDCDLAEESVEDNPFLARFYADMSRWAFQLNMYFLVTRAEALRGAATAKRGTVLDRSLYEDRLFVELARDDGVTPDENYQVFCRLYDLIVGLMPTPTLLIYLEASPGTLHKRITSRQRVFEDSIDVAYLERLQQRYDTFVQKYHLSPVLRFNTEATDVNSMSDVDIVCAHIRNELVKSHFNEPAG